MRASLSQPVALSLVEGRRAWLHAQRLDARAPFGTGPDATRRAIEHLGYVQIDTINVIERCHHHILWTRIPSYRREHLHRAQSIDKTVFEYWTHALSYVPTSDLRFFLGDMKRHRRETRSGFDKVSENDVRRVLRLIRAEGALTIRDIKDDVLVEKDHAWASRKPSKRALQLAFYRGALTISERSGMLKTYELTGRHFGWDRTPSAATARQVLEYRLDRALRAQGIVSLDSICHLDAAASKAMTRRLIEQRVRRGRLVPLALEGAGRVEHWCEPQVLEAPPARARETVHLLSPFDPLIIQRRRLRLFFGYEHRFEAYVPQVKRSFGYFALPVLVDDRIVAAIDLKADRANRRLIVQKWTWVGEGDADVHTTTIEQALHRFERFQMQSGTRVEESGPGGSAAARY